jgi:hypothetical protein
LRDFYDLADLEKDEDETKTSGILHYQVGGTDGVSLEIDKWKQVLEEMGHTVRLCAGDPVVLAENVRPFEHRVQNLGLW